jgi:transforming growth factor-beta-induced protein
MKKILFQLVAGVLIVAVVSLAPSAQAGPSKSPSIADIVEANPDIDDDGEGDFDTLAAAIGLADPSVLERLQSNGRNTVFAPTDAAFEAAFAELVAAGINPADVLADSDLLTLILNYHISPGQRASKNVLKSKTIRMRDGGFLSQSAGVLTDNLGREAAIIAVDIKAGNGIIHVIDNVVLPALP